MKSWLKGYLVVFALMVASLAAVYYYRRMDWINEIVVVFTFYNLFLMGAGILLRRRNLLRNDCYRPFVSILIPARNEEFVIENTLRSLEKMNYRKNNKTNFEIVVIDDCSTDNTYHILKKLKREYSNLRIIRRSPEASGQGKSAALNEGLSQCRSEIIGVFDADTRVDPNFLKKSVPYLYDPQVGGIQGRVHIYNARSNVLTSIQEDEFSVIAHCLQIARDQVNGMTTLGGNGQLTKREALEAVGGWNELSPTEDLDLTLRFLMKDLQVRYCPEAELWQEGVEAPGALLRQRTRWAEGFIKCLYDYFTPLLLHSTSLIKKFDGLITLTRVIIPFFLWLAYFIDGNAFQGRLCVYGNSQAQSYAIVSGSWLFFIVIMAAILKFAKPSFLQSLYRVARYWFYNLIWVVAVPLGFYNGIRNYNTIRWDKTFHKGEVPAPAYASVRKANYGYREAMEQFQMVPEK